MVFFVKLCIRWRDGLCDDEKAANHRFSNLAFVLFLSENFCTLPKSVIFVTIKWIQYPRLLRQNTLKSVETSLFSSRWDWCSSDCMRISENFIRLTYPKMQYPLLVYAMFKSLKPAKRRKLCWECEISSFSKSEPRKRKNQGSGKNVESKKFSLTRCLCFHFNCFLVLLQWKSEIERRTEEGELHS